MKLDKERVTGELDAVATASEMVEITGLSKATIYTYTHHWLDLGIAVSKGKAFLIHKQAALDWLDEYKGRRWR
jgi:hypothetical protein